jgi:hypothetical protein
MPGHSHLAQSAVRVAAHKLLENRAFELTTARAAHRARRQSAGLLTQRQPVIKSRAADVKQLMSRPFAQPFIKGAHNPFA